jgi:exopolyphosphatase / guanosine-5'-triphosphate,3'-diphosphate pyrophosphatase
VTRRVAAVDCGTNSLRLLLADVDPGRTGLTDVVRRMEIVRLGQGVDQTGRLAPEALARTMTVLRDYADVIARAGAQAVRMVATSATRDADNAAEFVRLVKEVLGVAPEVLTGDEEAVLSFTGATAELAAGPDPGPFLVADIGGGSTEFVLGPAGGRPQHGVSVNIGCVRMTERHLHSDPPAGQEVAAAVADIDAALDTVAAAVPARDARTLVGLAGSVTTIAAIAMGLPAYDAARIHHARVAAADVHAVTGRLLTQTRAERAAIGVMHPGRADVIGGGALVLDRLMQRFGFAGVLVSEHDILDGMAWSLAGDPPGLGTGAQWEQVPLSRPATGPMIRPAPARPSRAVLPRWRTWPPERARWTNSSRVSRSAAPVLAWWPGVRTWPLCAAVPSATSPTGAAPSPAGGRPGPRC